MDHFIPQTKHTLKHSLGEWPCVATRIYNTTITYVQMCAILF
jgi:hypothetical protein